MWRTNGHAGHRLLLLLILLLAATLRLRGLGHQSLWNDEVSTWECACLPWHGIIENIQVLENTPPPYYLAMNAWFHVVPHSDFTLRLPSALFGILAVGLMYTFAVHLFHWHARARSIGLAAALLLAVSRYHIAYSQEARAYSLMFLLALTSSWALCKIVSNPRTGWQFLYVLSTGAMLWVHTISVFVIAAQLAWLVFLWMGAELTGNALRRLLLLQALAAASFAPWLPEMMQVVAVGQLWMPRPHVIASYQTFADSLPALVCLIGLAVVGVGVAFKDRRLRLATVFLLLLLLVPVVLPIALSLGKRVIFVPRYGMAALIGMYGLAAFGAMAATRRAWAASLLILLPVGFALPGVARDFASGLNAQIKVDARAIATNILVHAATSDAIACPDPYVARAVVHYLPAARSTVLAGAPDQPATAARLWIVLPQSVSIDETHGGQYQVIRRRKYQAAELIELQPTPQPGVMSSNPAPPPP